MMKLFLLGAAGYPLLEMLYRRRTHYSMAVAGGLSAWMIGHVRRLRIPFGKRCLLCGLGVTCIEYVCGRIWNRHFTVWDYRNTPLNLHGQICLPFTAVWCGLSAFLMGVLNLADKCKGKRPGS